MSFSKNLSDVKEKIQLACEKSGRSPSEIRIVAVSKMKSVDEIQEAYASAHQVDFAENYVQEALLKMPSLADEKIIWHFIGHIQTNKVKLITEKFKLIHSVDSEKVILEISKRTTSTQDILLEVNLADEASKSGCTEAELPNLIDVVQKQNNVRLCGLMFMPPIMATESEQRSFFSKAYLLREKMKSKVSGRHNLDELSMGTSYDFISAVIEGATLLRLGTVLFGERK
jgi:PLP dependent protein